MLVKPPKYLYRASVALANGDEEYAVGGTYVSALAMLLERTINSTVAGKPLVHFYALTSTVPLQER